jgi:hypothetical protein
MPDWYLRQAFLRAMRGEPLEWPADPEEHNNVHSIAAARTRRATEQMLRARGF